MPGKVTDSNPIDLFDPIPVITGNYAARILKTQISEAVDEKE